MRIETYVPLLGRGEYRSIIFTVSDSANLFFLTLRQPAFPETGYSHVRDAEPKDAVVASMANRSPGRSCAPCSSERFYSPCWARVVRGMIVVNPGLAE